MIAGAVAVLSDNRTILIAKTLYVENLDPLLLKYATTLLFCGSLNAVCEYVTVETSAPVLFAKPIASSNTIAVPLAEATVAI